LLQVNILSSYNIIASQKGPSERFTKIEAVYVAAFRELSEQVSIHSNKRSDLLDKIWHGYNAEQHKYYNAIIEQKDQEIAKINQELTDSHKTVITEVKALRENFGTFIC
jgi:hypothetical protein